MSRVISHQQAKHFYDRFGSKQDMQRVYEDPALKVLEEHADFEHARAVVEFGCGTGRLARALFERRLGPEATYLGLDISSTMVDLARAKVAPWSDRAKVEQTEGPPRVPIAAASCDRFVSVYVFDLLSTEDARAAVAEAHRVLVGAGRLCLASLTFGRGALTRAVGRLWTTVYGLRPQLLGGCRPIRLGDILSSDWELLHQDVVCKLGLCTEIVVAVRSG
jgi:SAM-dependent methyltransferase